MSEKKVIAVIVEGPSDENAIGGILKEYFSSEEVQFAVVHGDITSNESTTVDNVLKKIDDIIEFSELGDFIDNPVRTYSSGMYMRLAFSVAINVQAEILLIDEILAVGDQHFQEKCFNKLIELKKSGKTIVIVTHSMDQVKRFCDRAVWLYKGEVRMDGNVSEVLEEYLKVCR